ncbi:MAG TPA: pitrilysin family protein [Gemmatimonadota bacterium]|nr:pitrilysin family protein [Gemmatimonadota bacterium]
MRGVVRVVASLGLVMGAGGGALGQVPDRSTPPELGPPPRLDLPDIQQFTLANGLPVLLMESHRVPVVEVVLVVQAGAADEPKGKEGLASMTAAMLDEGAGSRTALQVADAIDFLGATLATNAGHHSTVVTLHTPLSKLADALSIMVDVALRPTFPAEELERQRAERLTTLLQWRDEPSAIASVAFADALYGSGHPYGHPTMGSSVSVAGLAAEDLRAFYAARFKPGAATLVVAGDVTRASLEPLLAGGFGGWPTGTASPGELPAATQIERREIWIVDKPGAEQSEIRIGRIGADRLTEDYHEIVVMNTILGGSFTSRLNQRLREERGYSYGAYSEFVFRPAPGPFVAQAAVQTVVTDSALAVFMREISGILERVSESELQRAKNYAALGYPQNFETVASTVDAMTEIAMYDLPRDTFDRFIDEIMGVTSEDVERVARRYLDPDRVAIIVVGDRSAIEPGIRALNLGTVHVMTIADVLGPAPELGEDPRGR